MSISATILNQTKHSKHTNAVVFCVDENYLPYALFVALQIVEIDSYPIDICICIPDLSYVPEYFINSPIHFITIDVQGVSDLETDHLSIATYYRLFLPELLKKDYEYIIYLDADVYIRKPFLSDMFNIIKDFANDFSIAASPYIGEVEMLVFPKTQSKTIKNYLNRYHKENHLYRNVGVLIMNVHNFVENEVQQKVFNTINENRDKLESHDQSALNLTLLSEIELLPLQFNWQLNPLSASVINDIDPYIIHFINVNKPWITRTYYIEHYVNEYQEFMNKYFENHAFIPLTQLEKRVTNPKYDGIKEILSSKWFENKSLRSIKKSRAKFSRSNSEILTAIDKVNKGIHAKEGAS